MLRHCFVLAAMINVAVCATIALGQQEHAHGTNESLGSSAETLFGVSAEQLNQVMNSVMKEHKDELAAREKTLGPDHPDLVQYLQNCAGDYLLQGDPITARPYLERVLHIKEKSLGPNDPDLVGDLNAISTTYSSQGEYAKAEPLLQRALEISDKAPGADQPNYLGSGSDRVRARIVLIRLYLKESKLKECEPLYKESLAIDEKAAADPAAEKKWGQMPKARIASTLAGLATLYQQTNRAEQSEPLYKRALSLREESLGEDNPVVASSLNDLALLYCQQERFSDAEPLFKRAVAIAEKPVLFGSNPDYLTILQNYAGLLRKTNRADEAAQLDKLAAGLQQQEAAAPKGLLNLSQPSK